MILCWLRRWFSFSPTDIKNSLVREGADLLIRDLPSHLQRRKSREAIFEISLHISTGLVLVGRVGPPGGQGR